MLFVLATDTLRHMLQQLQPHLIQVPGAKTELLQFADDTIIFTPAHPQNLVKLKQMLRYTSLTTIIDCPRHTCVAERKLSIDEITTARFENETRCRVTVGEEQENEGERACSSEE